MAQGDTTDAGSMWVKCLLPIALLLVYVLTSSSVVNDSQLCLYGTWEMIVAEPWRIVTYAWTHRSVWHLATGLLILLVIIFGSKGRTSSREIWGVFVAGVAIGALTFGSITAYKGGNEATLTGASAGVSALIAYSVMGLLRSRSIVIGLVVIGLLILADGLTLSHSNIYGFYCHLSGYAVGAMLSLGKRKIRKKSSKLAYPNPEIVQKINTSGYNSLTDEEKRQCTDITPKKITGSR